MTKVTRQSARRTVRPSTESAVLGQPRKISNGYKVFFEQVAGKKKKLRLSDVTNPVPPRGYAFLSIGHADLAEYCKEVSRQKDIPVSIVSAVMRKEPQANISKHLHRIGYHFRQDIFDQGCALLGYEVKGGKLHREVLPNDMWGFEQITDGYGSKSDGAGGPKRQATEQEALATKLAIKELFPRIPHKDLEEIWRRAFRAGATTVGNATDLPLPRRVQLATVAHARHQYTEYDRLLRVVSWEEARARVQGPCLAKLVEWRGEQDDERAVEEMFREVIVIDDDDDDDDEEQNEALSAHAQDPGSNATSNSDTEVSIITKPATEADLAPSDSTEVQRSRRRVTRFGNVPPEPKPSRHSPVIGSSEQTPRHYIRESLAHTAQVPAQDRDLDGQGFDIWENDIEVANVPVDQFGRPPMRLVRDGITYVRHLHGQETRAQGSQPTTPTDFPVAGRVTRGLPADAEIIDLTSPPRGIVSSHTPHPLLGGQSPANPSNPSADVNATLIRRLESSYTGRTPSHAVQKSTELVSGLPWTSRSPTQRDPIGTMSPEETIFGRASLNGSESSSDGRSAFSA